MGLPDSFAEGGQGTIEHDFEDLFIEKPHKGPFPATAPKSQLSPQVPRLHEAETEDEMVQRLRKQYPMGYVPPTKEQMAKIPTYNPDDDELLYRGPLPKEWSLDQHNPKCLGLAIQDQGQCGESPARRHLPPTQ